MKPDLSIVVPCYNEEAALETTVLGVHEVARTLVPAFEIVIVDDGSRDRSGEIARSLAARLPGVTVVGHERNRGFGAAFSTGVASARGDLVTLIPADGQFPPEDLRRLHGRIGGVDLVVGFRVGRGDPLRRRITTTIFFFVMFFGLGVLLRDVNWVKLYRRRVLESVKPSFAGIGIDAQLMVGATRRGFRFAQTRVGYLPRTSGRSTGDDPRRIWTTLRELLRLGWGR